MSNPLSDLTTAGPFFAMRAGIADRLRAAFPVREFEHATVPARLTSAGWASLLKRTPFVGLGWGGAKPAQASGRRLEGRAEWTVFLVCRNPSGPAARLLGDPHGPGQLGMMQVAAFALSGLSIPRVGTVSIDGIANLYGDGWEDGAVAMTGLNISCGFTLATAPANASPAGELSHDANLDDFLRQAADWRFDSAATTAAADIIELGETA